MKCQKITHRRGGGQASGARRCWNGRVRPGPGGPDLLETLRLLAPEVLGEPVEPEALEGLRPGLAALAVEAALAVPGVEHLLPLRADRLPLRGPGHGRRAVARRGIFERAGVAAAERGRAVDGGGATPEPERLLDGEVPAGRRGERAADVLEPNSRREDADAERVLEAPPAAQPGDVLGHLLAVERVDPGRLPDFGRVHGVARLHRRGGRRARVEHLLPPRAMVVAARCGALLDVDRALLGGPAELLGGPLDALGEDIAEAFAAAHHPEQTVRALDIAPLELEAELLPGDVALLLALHDPTAEPAPFVDVHAGLVTFGVEPRDAVAVGRADRPAATRPALVLGLVDDLPLLSALTDDRHVAVVHAAGVALVAAMVEVLAKLGRFPRAHVGAGDVRRQIRRVVLDRQGAHLRQVHDPRQRAELVERARRRVRLEIVGHVLRRLHQTAGIGGAERLRALHDRSEE